MSQIASDELHHLTFKINVTGDFGKWITENGNMTIVLPIDAHVRLNSDVKDPLGYFLCTVMPHVDGAIRSSVKDRVDDLIADKTLHCTDVDHIHSIVVHMKVICIECNQHGSVKTGVTATLERRT